MILPSKINIFSDNVQTRPTRLDKKTQLLVSLVGEKGILTERSFGREDMRPDFAQYPMRQCMEEHDEVLPNQVGKPVKNPTIKWIAELMNVIAVVTIVNDNTRQRIVTNVKKVHQRIIAYFGPPTLEI